jgi:hypothetical protein
MKKSILIPVLILAFSVFFSCGKKSEQDQSSQREDTKKEEAKQQTKTVNEDSLRQAEENANKEKMVKFALEEEKIINDEKGQFAVEADASTTYAGDKKNKDAPWSPNQMTGKPNVEHFGDDGRAWAPAEADKGLEWVELTFPKAVSAEEIRIRQTCAPGAIIKIELIDQNGKSHTIWEGTDKTKYEPNQISWFKSKFDKTEYKTKTVKITLACNAVPGWNEIDAVQLIGE